MSYLSSTFFTNATLKISNNLTQANSVQHNDPIQLIKTSQISHTITNRWERVGSNGRSNQVECGLDRCDPISHGLYLKAKTKPISSTSQQTLTSNPCSHLIHSIFQSFSARCDWNNFGTKHFHSKYIERLRQPHTHTHTHTRERERERERMRHGMLVCVCFNTTFQSTSSKSPVDQYPLLPCTQCNPIPVRHKQ